MCIKTEQVVLGSVATNCYLIINDDEKKCVLVDPADNAAFIRDMIKRSGCTLKAVLLTHGHADHMSAADELRRMFGVKLYAGDKEKRVLKVSDVNLSTMLLDKDISLFADEWLSDGQELKIGKMTIKCLHTPGHTEGGVCYYIKQAGILFSGDTLFCASIGRTDFPTGSMSELVHSIKEKLFTLPDDTKIYPGHGESSTIAYEKQHNPYCQ